jgi:hypothetical protein
MIRLMLAVGRLAPLSQGFSLQALSLETELLLANSCAVLQGGVQDCCWTAAEPLLCLPDEPLAKSKLLPFGMDCSFSQSSLAVACGPTGGRQGGRGNVITRITAHNNVVCCMNVGWVNSFDASSGHVSY